LLATGRSLPVCAAQSDGGFNAVWHTIAPTFKAGFKGEGHEVSCCDLTRQPLRIPLPPAG
jgi:hypothetical protein